MTVVRRSSGVRPLSVLLLAVAVAATVPIGVLAVILPRPSFPPPPPLAVESVSISPDPPLTYESITVTARLSKGASATVRLAYVAAFGSTSSGGASMPSDGPRTYRTMIGPFPDGTEVWLVVVAATSNEAAHSDYMVFQVGAVVRNGSSGLRIVSVGRVPDQPGPGDSVAVTANITANGNYTEAFVETFAIVPSSAMGNLFRMDLYGTEFSTHIYAYSSALIAYRVVAQDTTGNTAVSEVFSFRVPPAPGPVP